MPTRRKKSAAADEPAGLAPSGLEPVGEAKAAPKRKHVVRRKPAATSAAVPTVPAAAPIAAPAAVEIPLKPHPPERPSAVLSQPPVSPGPRIPVDEDRAAADIWIPKPPEGASGLAVPPMVLQSPKKMPAAAVEDILEESERPQPMEFECPPCLNNPPRSGFFRRLGIGFALVALAVLIFVGYVTYARATVVVHPRKVEVKTERLIQVVAQPEGDEVPGAVAEITVSGERSLVPGAEPSAAEQPPAPVVDSNAVYVGTVSLINKTDAPVTLVPTTRLLAESGVLFRMKDRRTIPAGGTVSAPVYADKPGPTGAIAPSTFTVPGLPADKQKVIWAESKEAMTTAAPGEAPVAVAPKAVVKAEDIDNLKAALKDDLVAKAKEELKGQITGDWTGQDWLVEIADPAPYVSAAVGEAVDRLTVRLTYRVRQVSFDRQKVIDVAVAELKRGLTSDRELASVNGDAAVITIDQADAKAGTASLKVALTGESSVSAQSPLFDAEKLRGLDLGAVKAYFEGIEGVESVEVRFRPFWLKRMPDLKEHIEFRLE